MSQPVAFTEYLTFGQVGESRIAYWLRARGYHVLPIYEKEIDNGKGPRLFMAANSPAPQLIAPDMLIMREGVLMWIEAKHKRRFSWYGIGGYWVTGVDKRHYLDYIAVQERTTLPVWLMFLHTNSDTWHEDVRKWRAPKACPVGLYGNRLADLVNHISHDSDRHGTSGMVYWNIASLRLLASLDDVPDEF